MIGATRSGGLRTASWNALKLPLQGCVESTPSKQLGNQLCHSGFDLCLNRMWHFLSSYICSAVSPGSVLGECAVAVFLGKVVCSASPVLSGFPTPKPQQELRLLNLKCLASKASGDRVEDSGGCGAGALPGQSIPGEWFYGQLAVGDCPAYYHCLRQLLLFPGSLCAI